MRNEGVVFDPFIDRPPSITQVAAPDGIDGFVEFLSAKLQLLGHELLAEHAKVVQEATGTGRREPRENLAIPSVSLALPPARGGTRTRTLPTSASFCATNRRASPNPSIVSVAGGQTEPMERQISRQSSKGQPSSNNFMDVLPSTTAPLVPGVPAPSTTATLPPQSQPPGLVEAHEPDNTKLSSDSTRVDTPGYGFALLPAWHRRPTSKIEDEEGVGEESSKPVDADDDSDIEAEDQQMEVEEETYMHC